MVEDLHLTEALVDLLVMVLLDEPPHLIQVIVLADLSLLPSISLLDLASKITLEI